MLRYVEIPVLYRLNEEISLSCHWLNGTKSEPEKVISDGNEKKKIRYATWKRRYRFNESELKLKNF